jgi:hypothetical protein
MEQETKAVEGHMTVEDRERWADRVVQQMKDDKRKVRAAKQLRRRQRKRDARRQSQRNALTGESGPGLGSTKPMTNPETRTGGQEDEDSDPETYMLFDNLDPRPWMFNDSTDSEDEGFQLSETKLEGQEKEEKKTVDQETQWQLADIEMEDWSMEAAMEYWRGTPTFNVHTRKWEYI